MIKRPRYLLWLMQAEADLRSVEALTATEHYAQACFNAQQAAEKALKSIAFFRGAELVKTHSIVHMIRDLGVNGDLARFAPRLDLYYLSARYPDALPDNSLPSEAFTSDMANEAYGMASAFIAAAKSETAT